VLLGDNTDRATIEAREADHDVLGEMFLHFKEVAVVYNIVNDRLHIVCFVRVVRDDAIQSFSARLGESVDVMRGGSSRLLAGI